jgi:hypothetical protein
VRSTAGVPAINRVRFVISAKDCGEAVACYIHAPSESAEGAWFRLDVQAVYGHAKWDSRRVFEQARGRDCLILAYGDIEIYFYHF